MTPAILAKRLAKDGHKKVLVAGGSVLCSNFLAAGLVDELYLTLEPVLFGMGEPMLAERLLDISLRLQSVVRLNDKDTLLAHYKLEKIR